MPERKTAGTAKPLFRVHGEGRRRGQGCDQGHGVRDQPHGTGKAPDEDGRILRFIQHVEYVVQVQQEVRGRGREHPWPEGMPPVMCKHRHPPIRSFFYETRGRAARFTPGCQNGHKIAIIVDDRLDAGQFFQRPGRIGGGDGDDGPYLRGVGRGKAGIGILDDDAVLRRDAQPRAGAQIDVRIRFAGQRAIVVDDVPPIKPALQMEGFKVKIHVFSPCAGGDGPWAHRALAGGRAPRAAPR